MALRAISPAPRVSRVLTEVCKVEYSIGIRVAVRRWLTHRAQVVTHGGDQFTKFRRRLPTPERVAC